MRLSEQERKTIKETVSALDQQAAVYLFGSRVDDAQKGGDIDLLIFSQILGQQSARAIKQRLFEQIEEQKIDITISKDTSRPFVRLALQNAVRL